MLHRRTVLALLAASAVTSTGAFGQQAQRLTDAQMQLINDISAHNSSITTMVGRFLQVDTQGARIEGTFYLQRPGKIRFKYNPPSHEEIVSVGRGFYVIDRQERTQYAYPQDKVPLREFLDQKIDLLRSHPVAYGESDNYVAITLQDDTPAGTVKVELVFDKQTKDLAQWLLTNPNGSQLTFSLYDVQKDVQIPSGYFFIDPTFTPREPGT